MSTPHIKSLLMQAIGALLDEGKYEFCVPVVFEAEGGRDAALGGWLRAQRAADGDIVITISKAYREGGCIA